MAMGCGWEMGPVGWVFMGLFWLVTFGLLVWGAVMLLLGGRARLGGRLGGEPRDTPEEILDRRFALGEIDAERYRQARQELAAARQGR
jgi:putative membrane protein